MLPPWSIIILYVHAVIFLNNSLTACYGRNRFIRTKICNDFVWIKWLSKLPVQLFNQWCVSVSREIVLIGRTVRIIRARINRPSLYSPSAPAAQTETVLVCEYCYMFLTGERDKETWYFSVLHAVNMDGYFKSVCIVLCTFDNSPIVVCTNRV